MIKRVYFVNAVCREGNNDVLYSEHSFSMTEFSFFSKDPTYLMNKAEKYVRSVSGHGESGLVSIRHIGRI